MPIELEGSHGHCATAFTILSMHLVCPKVLQITLGPGQFHGFPKPMPANTKPCRFVRSTMGGFLADVLVSSMDILSGVSVFCHTCAARFGKCYRIYSTSRDSTTFSVILRHLEFWSPKCSCSSQQSCKSTSFIISRA